MYQTNESTFQISFRSALRHPRIATKVMPVQPDKWHHTFGQFFTDNCPLARKARDACSDTAMMPASIFRPPSIASVAKKTRNALSLTAALQNIGDDRWMSRIMEKAEDGGEIDSLFAHAVDPGDGAPRITITDEIRTREFVVRQRVGIGAAPRKVQATFMMAAAMILAPVVAGSSWKDIGPELCREMNWPFKKTYKIMLASAPRRHGKTRFVSMVVLNYALSQPGVPIIVYSTSQDTSNLLRQDVETLMREAGVIDFAGVKVEITSLVRKTGERQLRIASPYNMDLESIIYFRPSLNKRNVDQQVCVILYF